MNTALSMRTSPRPATRPSWPDTGTEEIYPSCRALHLLVEAQAARTPQATAVTGFGKTLTYDQLNRRANALAHFLHGRRVGPDVLVGICAQRSIEMVVATLAILKAGGAYVPLDPGYPAERLKYMMQDSRAPLILAQEKTAASLPPNAATVLCLDRDASLWAGESEENLPARAKPDDLAYVIYTSGSTGQPKGVAMRQEALINLLHWQLENFSFTEPARTLQFASLNFDVSFQEIYSTWSSGGTLVLISDEVRRNSVALLEYLKTCQVQRIFLPFIALKHLAEAAIAHDLADFGLREVITAGEQLQITPSLVEFFGRLDGCTLENQYGPSEAHVVTAYRLSGPANAWPALPPIGRPIVNAKVFVLDEKLEPVRDGEPGELFLGGCCLARGYLNRDDLTAAKFIPNLCRDEPDARLYRTGDLGKFLPDGNIEFLGRMDYQVKVGGFRIELAEVEAVLHQHPGVKEAVAVTRDSPSGDKQLVAYLVAQPGHEPRPSELRAFLKQKMPPYLVPSAFIRLPALPLNPNGKVDRLALPKSAALEEPEEDFSVATKMPKTPMEMQLKLVFERFFNRRPIGVDANFFELGGNSLQALNLIIELERATSRKLSLDILYQAATIEALATALESRIGTEWSSLVPLQPLGKRPPLFLVHTTPGDVLGYGNLVYHLGLEQPCYGLQSLAFHQPEQAHTRIEEMAAYYIKQLRAMQPEGPYFLGGWCYGGIVAVEMAHQLLAAGQKVEFLALIETPAPAPNWTNAAFYVRRLHCMFSMKQGAWRTYLGEKFKYYRGLKTTTELRFRRVEKEAGMDDAAVENQNRYLDRLELVYAANMAAVNQYRSRPYPGRVTLFNASEHDPALIPDSQYGWPGLAAEIETFVVPGTHDSILAEPQVRLLAQQINDCLATRQEARSAA
ncbi:MAG TPA: amino acid adenylation domain-containing protein [Candidatus Saccharimonadales bacterium]|nr:amino acid adenylation domain-containing protein [Candidatus Saccharimonadales bacterium]